MSRPDSNALFIARRLPIDPAIFAKYQADVTVFREDRTPTREELRAALRTVRAAVTLLSERIDASLLDEAPDLRIVANVAVGYDNIDVDACTARGVWVTNTPDVLTDATADLTWALILAVARRLREGERLVRSGAFEGWRINMLLGKELRGGTLGIVGLGRIGRAVGRRAEGFGMKVLHTSRSGGVPLKELLAFSDVVSIHAPLSNDTVHLIDADALAAMKRDAILINTARGPLVDEAALVAALEARRLFGAGLDVFEDEPRVHPGLLGRDDVVLLPHLGSATEHTRRRMAEIAVENALAVLRGEIPPNPVNAPKLRPVPSAR